MKSIQYYTYLLILTALLSSCGEDRTYQYDLLVADKIYMEETLKEHYLWYDEMPNPSENEYFNTPEIFFPKLLFKGNSTESADNYSYIEVNESSTRSYLQRNSTYGFDFELISDPTGSTTRIYARVLFVLPNSPASEAGLERGDWISAVGGANLTRSNYSLLIAGGDAAFTREELKWIDEIGSWEERDAITVSSSRSVELNPFYLDTLYVVNNQKVAYMVYNEFSTGPLNNGNEEVYKREMKDRFAQFKQQSPDAFILDLRYNPGGYLTMAIELASYLAPSAALGKTFVQLKHNDKTLPQIVPWSLNEDVAENLNLSRIYILTTEFTASASEIIIHCLKPYMGEENVIVLGSVTEGKNKAMAGFTKAEVDFTMWPVIAYTEDVNGDSNYSDGIAPTYFLNEKTFYEQLLPLGDTNEFLLKNALLHLTTNRVPDSETAAAASNTIYHSRMNRAVPATLLYIQED
ncbi:MAG: S41 family peptidase [Phocaeicola sp.]